MGEDNRKGKEKDLKMVVRTKDRKKEMDRERDISSQINLERDHVRL